MERSASKSELVLARLLRPFAKVEASEVVTAIILTLTVLFLLCGYYLLKPAREPLILLGGGAEVKSYAAAGQALLMLGVVKANDWLTRRFHRMHLIAFVTLFFASNLLLFYALSVA